jgi:hypothetical protein
MTTTYKNHLKLQNFFNINVKEELSNYWEIVKKYKEMDKIFLSLILDEGYFNNNNQIFDFCFKESLLFKLLDKNFFQLFDIKSIKFVTIKNAVVPDGMDLCIFDEQRLLKNCSSLNIGESFNIHTQAEYSGTDKDLDDAITLVTSDNFKVPRYEVKKVDNDLFSIQEDGYEFYSISHYSDYGRYGIDYM